MAASGNHSRKGRSVESLITVNLDVWSTAIKAKSAAGRGVSKKLDLYGIKKLRELILELAVRGLLVPQDSNEEPASELVKKIAAEKAKLEKENKIKKQAPLIVLTEDEKPFYLPKKWEWVKLGDLVEMFNGRAFKSTEWSNSGIPIVRIQNLNNESAEYNYYDGDVSEQNMIQSSTFLISWSGTPGTSFGAFIWKRGEAALNQHINKCNFHYPKTNLEYMRLAVNGCMNHFISMAQGGVGLKHVTKGTLNNAVFGLPPESEQHRIVAKVDELMALCNQLEQQTETSISAHQTLVQALLESLTNTSEHDDFNQAWARIAEHFDTLFSTEWSIDQLKLTILQLAVMGKLVPQTPNDEPASELLKKIAAEKAKLIKEGIIKKQKILPPIGEDEKPFKLPKGWAWEKLGELALKITDGTHHTPTYINEGVAFISVKDIDGKTVSFDDCKYISEEQHAEINKRCNPEIGDVLICRIGTLGRVTIVDTERPFSLFVSVGLIKLVQQYYIPAFAHIVLHSPLLLNQYEKIKAGGSHTNKLNLVDIPRLVLPIPPLKEQRHIVAKVDELLAICDTLKIHINSAQTTQLHLADALAERALN